MTCALCTVPNWENIVSKSDSLTLYVRLPTYRFFPMIALRNERLTTHGTLSSSRRKGLPLKPIGWIRRGRSIDRIGKRQRFYSVVRSTDQSITRNGRD